MNVSLNCRLLCACAGTYNVNALTGEYSPDPVYHSGVNYVTPPRALSSGQINACLVGRNSDGIVVAFRGTLPPSLRSAQSLRDWLQDFFEIPRPPGAGRLGLPGSVHSGFYLAVTSLIDEIARQIKTLNPDSALPVYVTGHSKGGAMAPIAAFLLKQGYGIPVRQVVTFASPRPGDSVFRTAYQAAFPDSIRFENYGDLIPLVPPANEPIDLLISLLRRIPGFGAEIANLFDRARGWNYQPVGTLSFVENSAGKYTLSTAETTESQILAIFEEIGRDLLAFSYSSIADAHSIDCGYGYMHGVCPSGVCDRAH